MTGTLSISSPDFDDDARIPDRFSADGGNDAPSLRFSGVPDGTVELVVIVHDPDAPGPQGFTHWVVYGIHPAETTLDVEADGVRQAPNSAYTEHYFGPQPPIGDPEHHYDFRVYALSRPTEGLPTRDEFLAEHSDGVLEQAHFVGTYTR